MEKVRKVEHQQKRKREKVRRQEIHVCEKVGKLRKSVFLPMICGSGGSKSRLAKAADGEPAGQRRDEQLHAVVVPSTFPSQKVQNTLDLEHFLKLRCPKSTHRCKTKHTSKAKCTKHHMFGPLLDIQMLKSAHCGCAQHMWKSKVSKSAGGPRCFVLRQPNYF